MNITTQLQQDEQKISSLFDFDSKIQEQSESSFSKESYDIDDDLIKKASIQLIGDSIEQTVVVCEAENNYTVKSGTPLFSNQSNKSKIQQKIYHHPIGKLRMPSFEMYDDIALSPTRKNIFYSTLDVIDISYTNSFQVENDGINQDFFSQKDLSDINEALVNNVDGIVVPNVEDAQHLIALHKIIKQQKNFYKCDVYAIIQNQKSVQNLQSILNEVKGIFLARGYLGLEVPMEKIFLLQKKIVEICTQAQKLICISSQILESMVSSIEPRCCEISDIIQIVYHQVDSIMLSQETSYGINKISCIESLHRIIKQTEIKYYQNFVQKFKKKIEKIEIKEINDCIFQNSILAAMSLNAKLIITITTDGQSVLQLSKLLSPIQILVVTQDLHLARSLSTYHAVTIMKVGSIIGYNKMTDKILNYAKQKKLCKQDDFVIQITSRDLNCSNNIKSLKIIKA